MTYLRRVPQSSVHVVHKGIKKPAPDSFQPSANHLKTFVSRPRLMNSVLIPLRGALTPDPAGGFRGEPATVPGPHGEGGGELLLPLRWIGQIHLREAAGAQENGLQPVKKSNKTLFLCFGSKKQNKTKTNSVIRSRCAGEFCGAARCLSRSNREPSGGEMGTLRDVPVSTGVSQTHLYPLPVYLCVQVRATFTVLLWKAKEQRYYYKGPGRPVSELFSKFNGELGQS